MPAIELINVQKKFEDFTAVSNINLRITQGEYIILLGPSGCGKTTLLRMIAGLTKPTEGDILINGNSVIDIPPEDRNIGYLFQNYALFPHLNVEENIGYGPRVRGEYNAEIKKITDNMLNLVKLLDSAGYMPYQLSGGMQQQIALARSLAAGCKILFLDEPMSSLDPKIGIKLRYEIQRTAKKLKLTVIHVTHDQSDAMSISDRIIVMRNGKIAQIGTPKEIYFSPVSPYVAHFVGESNFMLAETEDKNKIKIDGHTLTINYDTTGQKNIVAAIRPEKILFEKRLENTLEGTIADVKFMGPTTNFQVECNSLKLQVSTAKHPELKKGTKVCLYMPPEDLMIFDDIKNLEDELKIL